MPHSRACESVSGLPTVNLGQIFSALHKSSFCKTGVLKEPFAFLLGEEPPNLFEELRPRGLVFEQKMVVAFEGDEARVRNS
jgi:hypothetical protein